MGAIQQKLENGTIPFIELAMENLLEFDRVTKIPIYKALTYLSYVTQKDKAEASERKRITRQAKAKN